MGRRDGEIKTEGLVQRVRETERSWEWSGPGRHRDRKRRLKGRGGEKEGTSKMQKREEVGWGRASEDWPGLRQREGSAGAGGGGTGQQGER